MANYVSYSDATELMTAIGNKLSGKVDTSDVGSANGVAELDANGRVPSSQLPSYVDDVLEYADLAHFPATGETGKIYIAEDTNKTYRWSGSDYAEISESLALGETSSTAYAGNKGKANADAIAGIKNGTSINSFSAVETALANKANSNDLGDKSNLTTTDKSSCVGAINEVNSYFVDLGAIVGANINAFFKNVCAGFLALNPILIKPHNIFSEWSQHNNYFGQIVDINDDVVVATLTSAGGSAMISGYHRVTGDETVVYEYPNNTPFYGTVNIDPTYAVSGNPWEIERLGKLRILRIKHLQSIPSGNTNIGSVSSQDIPHNVAQIKVWGSTTDSHYNVAVGTDGVISIYSYAQTTTAFEVLTAELVYLT